MQDRINKIFDNQSALSADDEAVINQVLEQINSGKVRVAQKSGDQNRPWQINEWVKKAILLYFKIKTIKPMGQGEWQFFDKIPLKVFSAHDGVRAVPGAIARYGSFLESGCVMMPSLVNIGAYVGSGTMVDTWATVGSCAQIGKNVHLSGGVGIGGVLEPLQASPVIIEDNVFVGSRSIIVEGAYIQEGAVIGAGVTITGSTKIIDVTTAEGKTYSGVIPKNSVVIPGSFPKQYPAGTYNVNCALIIGQRKPSTDLKTSLNQALRDFNIA
jgi:2,3,4,5-tetrahydropyridine-2-carboxylate N-succinyltransferase